MFLLVTHLFKAYICDIPQGTFHGICPFLLTQRILLSPNHVNIVRDVIGSVVTCLSLAFALKPRFDVVHGTSIPCGLWSSFNEEFHYCSHIEINYILAEFDITHVPGANKHCDHVWLRLFRVLVLHLLKKLTKALSLLLKHRGVCFIQYQQTTVYSVFVSLYGGFQSLSL